jgi:hypothetical protein
MKSTGQRVNYIRILVAMKQCAEGGTLVLLRCTLDGLLLPTRIDYASEQLIAYDGDECFALQPIEAMYYEVVVATRHERDWLMLHPLRLLRFADDFHEADVQPESETDWP